jgi:hypothetical protein
MEKFQNKTQQRAQRLFSIKRPIASLAGVYAQKLNRARADCYLI